MGDAKPEPFSQRLLLVLVPVVATGIFGIITIFLNRSPATTPTSTPTSTEMVIAVNVLPSPTSTALPADTLSLRATPTHVPPTLTFTLTETDTSTPQPTDTPTLTFTPTDTPTFTSLPPTEMPVALLIQSTAIPTVQATHTAVITATATPGFPCDTTIKAPSGQSGTLFRSIVWTYPRRDGNSQQLDVAVRVGQAITVLDKSGQVPSDTWYQIQANQGSIFGWIPADYVTPSSQCP
jgi:hypothetical protein